MHRVIVDNDFAGDPDGLLSLLYLYATDRTRVDLVTSSPVDPELARLAGLTEPDSAVSGLDKASALVGLIRTTPPHFAAGPAGFDAREAEAAPAASAIVKAALADDPLPLTLLCGGPLTNVAAALRLHPGCLDHARIVWIGGRSDESAPPEYNEVTDQAAGNEALAAGLRGVRVTREVYSTAIAPTAEMQLLAQCGEAGAWVAERLLDLPPFVKLGETIGIGDCVLVQLAAAPEYAAGGPGWCDAQDAGGPGLLWDDLLARVAALSSRDSLPGS